MTKPLRIRRIKTAHDIMAEVRLIYREYRQDKIDGDTAKTCASLLRLMLECVKASDIENRIVEIEQLLEQNPKLGNVA